jgi:hypothetical protein
MSDDVTPAKVRLTDGLGPDERAALDALLDHIYEYGTNAEGVLSLAARLCAAAKAVERARCVKACRSAVYGRVGATTMRQVADWCAEEIASGRSPIPGA